MKSLQIWLSGSICTWAVVSAIDANYVVAMCLMMASFCLAANGVRRWQT